MPVDMKEAIAEAAMTLLMEKNKKKLTVKDIVDECQITRQAFYYHFEDIPELLRWIMERDTERLLKDSQSLDDPEQRIRYFFLEAINALPYLKRSMQSNYRDELESLLTQNVYNLFEHVIEEGNLYRNKTRMEVKLIMRYHCQAVLGVLREWTDEDTKNLDMIVHQVYLLMTGKVSPLD
ncbi:MAG TPA: TetR family transcriptional regulator [Candidatus Scatomorpha merdigallinarum]|nr:TetR family transcriptional regulator [Candidatus Scatomorpha merdigallinarum]